MKGYIIKGIYIMLFDYDVMETNSIVNDKVYLSKETAEKEVENLRQTDRYYEDYIIETVEIIEK